MSENELHERYIRLAFQYESAMDALLTRGLVDEEAASAAKERFYDTLNEEKLWTTQKIRDYHETISLYMRMLAYDGMVSLTELARQYSDESPGYVIQSWMRSRNTLEFLRQWENDMNEGFDDRACEELIHQGHTTSLTITPSLWIRKTHAVGIQVKQGKGGGVSAYPEIAAGFQLWIDPKVRLDGEWYVSYQTSLLLPPAYEYGYDLLLFHNALFLSSEYSIARYAYPQDY